MTQKKMTKQKREEIEILPEAGRLIEGLRDTGYTFNTAVADLIDNSIAAKAKKVDVNLTMDFRGRVNLYIADNGTGMSRAELENAMKYGSSKRRDPASLGKFGLGLKTASTAFCRRVVVLSRDKKGKVQQAEWDLDLVAKKNSWTAIFSEPEPALLKRLDTTANGKSGTLVHWDKVDRLIKEYEDPGGAFQRKALKKVSKNLHADIGMVFQRFLDRKYRKVPNVIISVNSDQVEPWDPFCTDIEGTEGIIEQHVDVDLEKEGGKKKGKNEKGKNEKSSFFIKAWVIPPKDEMTVEEQQEAQVSNQLQGFYIYRQDRLISHATTLGMWRKEPHSSLFRVQFDFDHTLDEVFTLDIKKSKIELNSDLYEWIDDFRSAPHRHAQNRYRGATRKAVLKESKGVHAPSNKNIGNNEESIGPADLKLLNKQTGLTEVHNESGKVRLKLRIGKSHGPEDIYLQVAKSLDDNVLWEPAITDGHNSVALNAKHEYYRKVYVPNHSDRVTMQGLDSLLWALSVAELKCVDEDSKENFEELRWEVSRILRKLVAALPEPNE